MSQIEPVLFAGRRARRFDDVESIDAVTRPFISRFVGNRTRARFLDRNDHERRALAVIVAERAAEEMDDDPNDDRTFFERLVDKLSDPEFQAKLENIIAWFFKLLETFGGLPT